MRDAAPSDLDAILAINVESRPGVSALTPTSLERLLRECARFRVAEVEGRVAGYLCAMDRDANDDGDELRWFREHVREEFLYVDQVAIARRHRRRGLGRALYDDLEATAARLRVSTLVCEVNVEPLNAASIALHVHRGFREVGRMATRGVVVSLMRKDGIG